MTKNNQSKRTEIERRIVQPTEFKDILAEITTALKNLNTDFARVVIEPTTKEKYAANKKLVDLISQTDKCLNCGKSLDKGGFCGHSCLVEWGSINND